MNSTIFGRFFFHNFFPPDTKVFPMQKVGLWQEESSPIATLGGFVEWGLLGLIFCW